MSLKLSSLIRQTGVHIRSVLMDIWYALVKLEHRTLFKKSEGNSFCLPFEALLSSSRVYPISITYTRQILYQTRIMLLMATRQKLFRATGSKKIDWHLQRQGYWPVVSVEPSGLLDLHLWLILAKLNKSN